MKRLRFLAVTPLIALLMSINASAVGQEADGEDTPPAGEPPARELTDTEREHKGLQAYLSGEREADHRFWGVHGAPKAGQRATYSYSGGTSTYHVVSADDQFAIIEVKYGSSETALVRAYEVGFREPYLYDVRRAWVGLEGGMPWPVAVATPKPENGPSVGLGGSGTIERGTFKDLEVAGRKWSGYWINTSYRDPEADDRPVNWDSTKRWWSEEDWFNETLLTVEYKGLRKTASYGLTVCSEQGPALLDWSDTGHADEEKVAAAQIEMLERIGDRLIASESSAPAYLPAVVGEVVVGESANYVDQDGYTYDYRVVAVDEATVLYEVTSSRWHFIKAYRIDRRVNQRGRRNLIEAWIGKPGEAPLSVQSLWLARPPFEGESITRKIKPLIVSGLPWHGIYTKFTPSNAEPIHETWRSNKAPLGWPLKEVWTSQTKDIRIRSKTLTKYEYGHAEPLLDWSKTVFWKLPWEVEDVAEFIRPGLVLEWRESLENEEGDKTTGYRVETVLKTERTRYQVNVEYLDSDRKHLRDNEEWRRYSVHRGRTNLLLDIEVGSASVSDPIKVGERTLPLIEFKYSNHMTPRSRYSYYSPELPGIGVVMKREYDDGVRTETLVSIKNLAAEPGGHNEDK